MSKHFWFNTIWLGIVSGLVAIIMLPTISLTADNAYPRVAVWWPSPGAVMDGEQPLKAVLTNYPVDQYTMTWSVDGGSENQMYTSGEGSAHKQADVQLSGWTWKGAGPYTLTFNAYSTSDHSKLATSSITFARTAEAAATIGQDTAVGTTQAAATTAATQAAATARAQAIQAAQSSAAPVAAVTSRLSDNGILSKLASIPQADWLTGNDPGAAVNDVASNSLSSLVVYDIPGRDCGSYSAGGAGSSDAYMSYIRQIAADIAGRSVRVILEPDALSEGCVDTSLLSTATQTLSGAGARVYLDAGHAGWVSAATMAQRLNAADIADAAGFSLNVSNFDVTSSEVTYGAQISSATGGKHFVIDTSRNGAGSNGQWCNPSGRALGTLPTTSTGNGLVDALLWIKKPGESDGACNGGPNAGVFWPGYALGLAHNAGW